ncbi:nucleoside deaminase [Panacibacter sp. DH6]|uniref:Nucleoside deaminase n=1 Tax=Panacibacter microcysteis TaxID=2793269 RepID=A0A931GZK0_9BACT|nr:nucleoside deaminase [Panacibacter microcysteis]MBG9378198.1 nucleoside deaminase [Panacibacter microcysteis]
MPTTNDFIEQCITLGKQAAEKGNSAVGALLVRGEVIIGAAEEATKTKNDITCHAEMEAIRQAVKTLNTNDLSDCVLYSTHEPCIMCSYAIRFYKIRAVFYLQESTYLGGVSSALPLLTTVAVPPGWSVAPHIHHITTW